MFISSTLAKGRAFISMIASWPKCRSDVKYNAMLDAFQVRAP